MGDYVAFVGEVRQAVSEMRAMVPRGTTAGDLRRPDVYDQYIDVDGIAERHGRSADDVREKIDDEIDLLVQRGDVAEVES